MTVVPVTVRHIMWARIRAACDRRLHRTTPAWITRLATTHTTSEEGADRG